MVSTEVGGAEVVRRGGAAVLDLTGGDVARVADDGGSDEILVVDSAAVVVGEVTATRGFGEVGFWSPGF